MRETKVIDVTVRDEAGRLVLKLRISENGLDILHSYPHMIPISITTETSIVLAEIVGQRARHIDLHVDT